jgi:uncharacterized membrane protein YkoI
MARHWTLTLASLVLALTLSLNAAAEMTKSSAAKQAQSQFGGKVLSVEKTASKDGKTSYRVKLLQKKGRVKTVIIRG